jgi:dihydrofolate reductase
MKVFIIAAQTLDGFIAKSLDQVSTNWTSTDDKKFFTERTKKAGVVVMGSSTYRTFNKPLKDRLNIVYSRNESFEGTEKTSLEPKELVKDLEARGFSEVAICGGSSIYTLFLKAGVVDTIYLTIEPILFGNGISLLNENIDLNLALISEEKTSSGTLFLEYKVLPKNV